MAGKRNIVKYVLSRDRGAKKPSPDVVKPVAAPVSGIHECKFYGEFGCCRHPRMCGKAEVHSKVGTSHMTGCVERPGARNRCINYQATSNRAAVGFANVLILDPCHGIPYLDKYFALGQTEGGRSIASTMISEYNAWKKEREDDAQKKLDVN